MKILNLIFFYGVLFSGWYGLYYVNEYYGAGMCIAAFVIFIVLIFFVRKLSVYINNFVLINENDEKQEDISYSREPYDEQGIPESNIMDDINDAKDNNEKK